eukprot:178874_1
MSNNETALLSISNGANQHQTSIDEEVQNSLRRLSSILYEEMDTDDPLKVDLNESEWLKCCNGKIQISLTSATIFAAIVGATIGSMISLYVNLSEGWYKIIILPGNLWIRALKLLILPLLALMMVILPSRVDEVGVVGKKCVPLLVFTSLCASIHGSIWGWTIRPGDYGEIVDDNTLEPEDGITELDAFLGIFYSAIPQNIIVALSELSVLGIIIFFLCLGLLLRDIQIDEKIIVLKFSKALLKCSMKAIVIVIWWTPLGMLSLITAQIAYTENLPSLLTSLGVHILTLMLGFCFHVFIFLPIVYFIMVRKNVCDGYKLLTLIYEAPLLAFATASSAATLPRSLMSAQKANISKSVYQFVIPLGAAINMDGSAVMHPINIALIAQLYDINLSIGTIAMVAILSVVVSIGAAPIPHAGIMYSIPLLKAAGLEQYETQAISTFFVIDWLVARLRTVVNVISDQYVAKICDEILITANKKNVNVYCGCCYGKKRHDEEMIHHIKEQELF